MKPTYFLWIILVLTVLACQRQVYPPAPTPSAAILPTDTPKVLPTVENLPTVTAVWTAQVSRPQINVRNAPDGDPTGEYLRAGDVVTILSCVDNWCNIESPSGWVWIGCLEGLSDKGCEAK